METTKLHIATLQNYRPRPILSLSLKSFAHVLCTWMPLVTFGPRGISLHRTLLEYINSHAYKRLYSVYIYCTKLTPMKLQGLKALNTKRPTLVFFLAPTKPLQTYE